jgi:hypothetical protein
MNSQIKRERNRKMKLQITASELRKLIEKEEWERSIETVEIGRFRDHSDSRHFLINGKRTNTSTLNGLISISCERGFQFSTLRMRTAYYESESLMWKIECHPEGTDVEILSETNMSQTGASCFFSFIESAEPHAIEGEELNKLMNSITASSIAAFKFRIGNKAVNISIS